MSASEAPTSSEYFVVGVLSKLLTDLVARNDQVPHRPTPLPPQEGLADARP